jgi:hypothetical protein
MPRVQAIRNFAAASTGGHQATGIPGSRDIKAAFPLWRAVGAGQFTLGAETLPRSGFQNSRDAGAAAR